MKKILVKADARNRVCLTKVLEDNGSTFYAYKKNGKIILEPIIEVPADEAWLFLPENKALLQKVQEGLQQVGTIKRK